MMMPSWTACSMTRTRTAMVFLTVERLCSSAIQMLPDGARAVLLDEVNSSRDRLVVGG